jgi:alginate production protein
MRKFVNYTLLVSAVCISMPALADEPNYPKRDSSVAFKDDSINTLKLAANDDSADEATEKTASKSEGIEKSKLKKLKKAARKLGISNDDSRPEQLKENTLLGRPLYLGGEVRGIVSAKKDYDLKKDAEDDITEFKPDQTLELFWLPSDSTAVFATVRGSIESTLYKEGGNRKDTELDLALRSLWLLQTNLLDTPFAIQVGRQRLQDDREWWWDEHLDAARLHYFGSDVTAFVGVGKLNKPINTSTLNELKPNDQDLLRYFGNIDWKWSKNQHVGLFAVHQDDKSSRYAVDQIVNNNRADDADARITWLGASANGCIKSFCYWGDVARMRGRETEYDLDNFNAQNQIVDDIDSQKLRGTAYDVGMTVKLPLSFKPRFTISHAKGTGDKPRTPGRDGAFRQTGIQQNEGKYEGNSRFQYYGEVLRPNLSNIAISTLAVGIPVTKHGWVETIWHDYKQDYADNRISGANINNNPNGNNKHLGQEIDVIMSYRPDSPWEFELTGGAFRAGRAFEGDKGRWAKLIELRVDYNF